MCASRCASGSACKTHNGRCKQCGARCNTAPGAGAGTHQSPRRLDHLISCQPAGTKSVVPPSALSCSGGAWRARAVVAHLLWYEERRAIWRAATCERRAIVHNRLPPSPARARHVRSCKRLGPDCGGPDCGARAHCPTHPHPHPSGHHGKRRHTRGLWWDAEQKGEEVRALQPHGVENPS